jgi:hypothetical protein
MDINLVMKYYVFFLESLSLSSTPLLFKSHVSPRTETYIILKKRSALRSAVFGKPNNLTVIAKFT